MITKIKNILGLNRKKASSISDYPAYMQKSIVNCAIDEANEMQMDLIKKYEKKYSSRKATL